jgi:hypothetical protein
LGVNIVDAKGNGFVFSGMKNAADVTVTSGKVSENEFAVLSGAFTAGVVTGSGNVQLNDVTVGNKASLVADKFEIVTANSTTHGILKAKEIKENTGAELAYEATFADGDYTVYTDYAYLNANFDKLGITDVVLTDTALGDGQYLDLSKVAANITLEKDAKISLSDNAYIILGTASTSIGAGYTFTGNIYLVDTAFAIVYPNMDVSAAKFIGVASPGTTAAKSSVFDIEGTEYATVYAAADTTTNANLLTVSGLMDVKISGYTFTYWTAYGTGAAIAAGNHVGTTDATALLVAGKVTITIAAVEGVTYYLDGVEYLTTDLATKVTVGSVVTMKISDTSKYQGTPKIDGKTNYVVSGDSDGKTITATGVSPVEPEPAPAPAGMSLTEILLIVLVVLIAIMVVIIALRLNRS